MNQTAMVRPKRALFYSHDTMGLGHIRRTLLICEGLRREFPDLSSLIVTGSSMAHCFRLPPGLDYVKLPSVKKVDSESYESRSIALSFNEIWKLRHDIICQTVMDYKPDFFFVDNVPLGMKGEISSSLEYVGSRLPGTRVFLILRDILDDSSSIIPSWQRSRTVEALSSFYHRIFVCGLPAVFNPIVEYQWPEPVSRKVRFCGYIPRSFDRETAKRMRRELCGNREKLVVVTVGGGSDGGRVVESYLQALPLVHQKLRIASVVLLGSEMGSDQVRCFRSAQRNGHRIEFMDFCNDAVSYMAAADLVVSMGGYNTVSEIVWLRKKAIVIPRIQPRTEQLIRSRRLQELGLLQMIHPRDLDPRCLAERIVASLDEPAGVADVSLAFTALREIATEIRPFIQAGEVDALDHVGALAR